MLESKVVESFDRENVALLIGLEALLSSNCSEAWHETAEQIRIVNRLLCRGGTVQSFGLVSLKQHCANFRGNYSFLD